MAEREVAPPSAVGRDAADITAVAAREQVQVAFDVDDAGGMYKAVEAGLVQRMIGASAPIDQPAFSRSVQGGDNRGRRDAGRGRKGGRRHSGRGGAELLRKPARGAAARRDCTSCRAGRVSAREGVGRLRSPRRRVRPSERQRAKRRDPGATRREVSIVYRTCRTARVPGLAALARDDSREIELQSLVQNVLGADVFQSPRQALADYGRVE